MRNSISIKCKAAFLLVVFTLNTIVGFACSIGMDMGFNSTHHTKIKGSEINVHIHADGQRHEHHTGNDSERDKNTHPGNVLAHVHKDGKQPIHKKNRDAHSNHKVQPNDANSPSAVHIHKNGKQHVHGELNESIRDNQAPHLNSKKIIEERETSKENCCTDEVIDFQQLDKSIPDHVKVVHPISFATFNRTYYDINLLPLEDVVRDIKLFVRSYHPPIPDIRIAIQSFLI